MHQEGLCKEHCLTQLVIHRQAVQQHWSASWRSAAIKHQHTCSIVARECTSTAVGVLHTSIMTSTSSSSVLCGNSPECRLPRTTAIPARGCTTSLLKTSDAMTLGGTCGPVFDSKVIFCCTVQAQVESLVYRRLDNGVACDTLSSSNKTTIVAVYKVEYRCMLVCCMQQSSATIESFTAFCRYVSLTIRQAGQEVNAA